MNIYEAHMSWADRLRDLKLTPLARLFYFLAFRIGGDQDRHCQQMMAVCYVMEHRVKKADKWFQLAEHGASEYQRANIFRDRARRYLLSKDYADAVGYLKMSLRLLPRENYPGPWAQSKSFMAQVYAKEGSSIAAMECYEEADAVLREEEDLRPCLFNKLHMTRHYLKSGHYGDARRSAYEAYDLARQLKMWPHLLQARRYIMWGWCQEFDAHWP